MVLVGIKLPEYETTTGVIDDAVRGKEVIADDTEVVVYAIVDDNVIDQLLFHR